MSTPNAPHTVVVRHALMHVTPSHSDRGDVMTTDGVLTHLGPGPPRPPAALVLDGAGPQWCPSWLTARPATEVPTPVPDDAGSPAAFAGVHGVVSASRIGQMLMVNSRDMLAVVLGDDVVVWDHSATALNGPGPDWVGAWTDPARGMTQHLTEVGRYRDS